jgi:pimeloyl-ACP methyl ester carboxylesterase
MEGGPGAVPFLLVHGLASNARMWDGVAVRLGERGYPSAAVDLRGHGQSPKPDTGFDMVSVSDDLAELIKTEGWDRPVAVGQSWGGNVVVELAWRFPELVRGAVGIDGGTIELAPRFETWDACVAALSPPPLAGTPLVEIEQRLRATHPDWPETGIEGALANFEVRADGTVAPWLTLERHLQILRGLWQHRPSERLGAMEVPVLLVPAEPAGRFPPGVKVVPMEGDHDLHAQHPVAVADLLVEHVENGFFR